MGGIQVFAEYQIITEKREDYFIEIENIKQGMKIVGVHDFQVYEGLDQPGLFLEMFHVPSEASYRKLKRKRCEPAVADGEFWQSINPYIEGGTAKLHMWAFVPVNRSEA